tara:strand:- start:117 stop:1133 length:1017 start_codon:yes stop_codon:yes gene_type:complete
MQVKREYKKILNTDLSNLLITHNQKLLSEFYEMQSSFLTDVYKKYHNIEKANIVLYLSIKMHLEILREREKNMDHNISLENFWYNYNNVNKPTDKIISIVRATGIPKETARRKIKDLLKIQQIKTQNNKNEYYWNVSEENINFQLKSFEKEIEIIAKFVSICATYLRLNMSREIVVEEIKSQFSFYWYHFLSSQLKWLKMWHDSLEDLDLVLIILQAVIPTLQHSEKLKNDGSITLDNLYMSLGKITNKDVILETSISASSVADVTGIPRVTCIRKLDKLVELGLLIREVNTKRYFVNQQTTSRTKKIFTKENVSFSIENFSNYLAIIINSIAGRQFR